MTRRSLILFGLLLLVGVLVLALLLTHSGASDTCHGTAPHAYEVTIQNRKAAPANVNGRLCDTLTIKNLDKTTREIAFGNHDAHVPYDGVAERILNKNQSLKITFNKTGSYHWHDHLHDEVEGYFTVGK